MSPSMESSSTQSLFIGAMRALAFMFALGACSSTKDAEPPFADPEVAGRAANPDGVAYPTDHVGGLARSGARRGDRIPNLSFQGYPDSNRAGGLRTVSLADYYNPTSAAGRPKVLHLMEAAYWCTICDGQTKEMTPLKDALGAEGVVVVQAIMNGARVDTGPSLLEVGQWMDRYPTWFTVVIDERAKRVGTVTEVLAVPWNALVDLRTMEILYAGSGRPVDYASFTKAGVDWVTTHPPSY